MRSAGNFSPEWGYLAPAPSFVRTARIVVVATAIGAIAGAGVVLSLVDRPVADNDQASVGAHAVVSSVEAAPATGAASNDAAAGSSAAPVNVSTAAPARVLSAASVASRAVNPPTNVPAENPDVGRAADVGRSADSGKANVYPAPKPVQGMAALGWRNWLWLPRIIGLIFVSHVVYGLGFWRGCVTRPKPPPPAVLGAVKIEKIQ